MYHALLRMGTFFMISLLHVPTIHKNIAKASSTETEKAQVMPALLSTLIDQNTATNFSTSSPATNTTSHALQVVCVWPVSGQYGPGSRALCALSIPY
jgi:hypothetical protein